MITKCPAIGEFEERERAGLEGLAKALDAFDPTQGVPFKKFAPQAIIWAIHRYTDNLRTTGFASFRSTRYEASFGPTRNAIMVARRRLSHRFPHLDKDQIASMLTEKFPCREVRLDAQVEGESGETFEETNGGIIDSRVAHGRGGLDAFENADLRNAISAAVRTLPVADRLFFQLRFVEDMDAHEVAQVMRLSKSGAYKREKALVSRLQHLLADAVDLTPDGPPVARRSYRKLLLVAPAQTADMGISGPGTPNTIA
jgi:RNA polymerase sigma factor (sigma-70 family)